MNKISFSRRLRYWFENAMSKGPLSLIGWLFFVAMLVIFFTTFIAWLSGENSQDSFAIQIWKTAMFVLKPPALKTSPSPFGVGTLILVLTGIFVMSTLIGLITTGIRDKFDELRKGRTKVIESGHTVILGWFPRVYPLLSELLEANRNQEKATIVIMGDEDRTEMERKIKKQLGSQIGRTKIICRRGNSINREDLKIVSLDTAKAILILAQQDDNHDSTIMLTLLAIVKNKNSFFHQNPYHIVTTINDSRNMDIARSICPQEVEIISPMNFVSRILSHTCRLPGVAPVYGELLDFDGDEIYMQKEPLLVGRTYEDALLAYEDSAVIGIYTVDGCLKINPDAGTIFQEGDEIIAISEDDDTVLISEIVPPSIQEENLAFGVSSQPKPEHIIVLGWNDLTASIIEAIDCRVAKGSSVTILANFDSEGAETMSSSWQLANQICNLQNGDPSSREAIESLLSENIDHVMVFPKSADSRSREIDAQTLIAVLHLRDIAKQRGLSFSIVSEFLDGRIAELVEADRSDDCVVSEKFVSLLMAQIAENKKISNVFQELCSPEGSEIYLRPASHYVKLERSMAFYSVVKSALRQGETAIGYKVYADSADAAKNYGVNVNPMKSQRRNFEEQDKIIVLAKG